MERRHAHFHPPDVLYSPELAKMNIAVIYDFHDEEQIVDGRAMGTYRVEDFDGLVRWGYHEDEISRFRKLAQHNKGEK